MSHSETENLSVWNWSCGRRYYLTHPWVWFKELWWNMKYAHQRATKGYCVPDWINFDLWFKIVSSHMLRDMAMKSWGYPGVEPFDTPEKWSSWLHRMSDQMSHCIDEDENNEYYKPYTDSLMGLSIEELGGPETPERKELRLNYQRRWEEISKEQHELFKKTMLEMLEHWDYLWD